MDNGKAVERDGEGIDYSGLKWIVLDQIGLQWIGVTML